LNRITAGTFQHPGTHTPPDGCQPSAAAAALAPQLVGSRIDTTSQANYLGAYDLTNLRAGVEGSNWTAVLFVNNVTNRLALLTNSPAINVAIPTFNRTAMEQPLTFGIDLSYRMGR
jgi:hypothetical protein